MITKQHVTLQKLKAEKSLLETDKIAWLLHSYRLRHLCDKEHLLDGKDEGKGHVTE